MKVDIVLDHRSVDAKVMFGRRSHHVVEDPKCTFSWGGQMADLFVEQGGTALQFSGGAQGLQLRNDLFGFMLAHQER